jgi:hypothetical protein
MYIVLIEANQILALLREVLPTAWQQRNSDADFDTIQASLDQLERAAAGQYIWPSRRGSTPMQCSKVAPRPSWWSSRRSRPGACRMKSRMAVKYSLERLPPDPLNHEAQQAHEAREDFGEKACLQPSWPS